ncbi:hypothetical protein EJA72_14385 [Pseudomonas sp. PB120]|uniref:hypothetical protein n=1 Tax=Pseudomonas sp. PB120 TaxID=2494700 RepID=UPI0012FE4A79|nr:hypothetical protein [Pseudomonas sp. PB120]MVV49416.1 hypothetical protein [Pseudomonas sp. PB120]
MSVPPPDLEEIQRRLNEGLKAFIEAEKNSVEDDELGRKIVKTYLAKFRDDNPDWSERVKQFALEAQLHIDGFEVKRGALSSRVCMAHMQMKVAITSIMIQGFQVQQASFNRSTSEEGDAVESDPTLKALNELKRLSADTKRAEENLNIYQAEAQLRAAEIGNLVIRVQCLATVALLMRRSLFQMLARDKLDVSWEEVARRISEALEGSPKDWPVTKALDIAGRVAIEIVKIVIEDKLPVATVHSIFKILGEQLGVRKADTKPGGTNDMFNLLEELEKLDDLLGQLDRTYTKAMDEIPLRTQIKTPQE